MSIVLESRRQVCLKFHIEIDALALWDVVVLGSVGMAHDGCLSGTSKSIDTVSGCRLPCASRSGACRGQIRLRRDGSKAQHLDSVEGKLGRVGGGGRISLQNS
jgi:hypothetical protein